MSIQKMLSENFPDTIIDFVDCTFSIHELKEKEQPHSYVDKEDITLKTQKPPCFLIEADILNYKSLTLKEFFKNINETITKGLSICISNILEANPLVKNIEIGYRTVCFYEELESKLEQCYEVSAEGKLKSVFSVVGYPAVFKMDKKEE